MYNLPQIIKMLEDIGHTGLRSGGEQYPNAECCFDAAETLRGLVNKDRGHNMIKLIFDTHKYDFPVESYEIRNSEITGKLMVRFKGEDGRVKVMYESEYIPFIEPDYYAELEELITSTKGE